MTITTSESEIIDTQTLLHQQYSPAETETETETETEAGTENGIRRIETAE